MSRLNFSAQDTVSTISETALKSPLRKRESSFYLVMSLLALVVVIAGFSTTYVVPMAEGKFSAMPIIHIHGVMFFFWILLAIVQPFLVRLGNTRIHKRVGTFGAFYAAAILIIGTAVAVAVANRDIGRGLAPQAKAFLLIPLTDMLLFGVFAGLAFFQYRNSESHKRLMLLANVALLPAPFSRFFTVIGLSNFVVAVLIMDCFLFAGVVCDLISRKRIHPVYLLVGAFLLSVHFGRAFAAYSEIWLSVAEAITG